MAGFRDRQGNGGQPPQYGQQQYGAQGYDRAPGHDDAPGHTRAFTMGEPAPLAYGTPSPDAEERYAAGGPHGSYGEDHVATYRAGQAALAPSGPRLHWKPLLSGIIWHPVRTFWQMRDHSVWGPALTVTFLYGLLAVFGFESARHDVLSATPSTAVPLVAFTGVAVVLCGLTLGAVTNALARQLGGDGSPAPTIGLAMIVTSLTDVPRLVFALFLGGDNGFVQLLGWVTWLACAALLAALVRASHDLPRLKALGAASIQLVALLILFKLPLI